MVGCTSSVRPTSRYWTLPVTTGAPEAEGVTLLVMTGSLLPISTFAFSLLRARIRGLARELTRPACFIAFTVTAREPATPTVSQLWCDRSESSTLPEPPPVAAAAATCDGLKAALVGRSGERRVGEECR